MAIIWKEVTQTLSLQTRHATYQMKVDELGFLLHTYYGRRLEDPEDLSYQIAYADRGNSGNPYEAGNRRSYSLDCLPQEYACYGAGDYRQPALKVCYANGTWSTKLKYRSHTILEGKYALPGLPAVYAEAEEAQTLRVELEDLETGLQVSLLYGVLEETDTITRAVVVKNQSDAPLFLERVMSGQLDFQDGSYELMTFYGKHAMERMVSRTALTHGVQSVGSSRGASSHHYNPMLVLCDPGADEVHGSCYGLSLVYSGDFLAEAEKDFVDQARILMGIGTASFRYQLAPGEEFYAPELVMVYSPCGLGEMSRQFHRLYRKHLCRGNYRDVRRPVLINNWEGTYFQFDGETLFSIAKEAGKLGVELFVMDDGWFGKRDDDNSGLGDWEVNEKKLGCSLRELGERIEGIGMKFGIWFEPECINEDSDLYRAHPDWVLQVPGKLPTRSRNQLVLDYSRADVREHIYQKLTAVLDQAPISYVKWDFNRNICDIYSAKLSPERQGEVAHRYVLGLYELLERLTSQYPEILFEGCSAGGGRFDPGILYYMPQFWCSDNTDAIDRLLIQYGTSFVYPVSTMGAHVSASPNHQTGRVTPFHTRGVVAMSGAFGYELDVNRLSEEERIQMKEQIQTFKELAGILQYGDYYRLTNPYENQRFTAWEMVDPESGTAVVQVVHTSIQANPVPRFLRLKGLQRGQLYEIEGKQYRGETLMQAGLLLPTPRQDYVALQYVVRPVKEEQN